MLSHVHDTIDTCRDEDDIGNHNLPSHKTNMLSPENNV